MSTGAMVQQNICYVIFLIILQVLYISCKKRDDSGPVETLGQLTEGVAAVNNMPWSQYSLLTAKDLSKSTQFGIKDVVKNKWLLRVDQAHGTMKSAHININPVLTRARDPHLKIPDAAVPLLGGTGQVLHTVGNVAMGAGILIDGVRLTSDVLDDISKTGTLGKKTVKTAASIGGGWAGGFGGAYVGNSVGGWIGGTVGSLFGGVGAIPGAAIGSMIGAAFGGITGSIKTSEFAEAVVD